MYSVLRRWRSAPALLAVIAAFAVGCSDTSSPTARAINVPGAAHADVLTSTATVVVLVDSATLTPPHKSSFHAYALNALGDTLRGKTATFSSSNPAVATVSPGWATAVKPGIANVQVTVEGIVGRQPITIAGPATHLGVSTQPGGAMTGVALAPEPVVQVRDAGNNVVKSGVAVTAAIATGVGQLLGTTTINAVNGVANFTDLRVNGGGAYTLKFTSAPLAAATSNAFTITAQGGGGGGAASLAIQTQPAGATTGSTMTAQPVVRILDANGALLVSAALPITVARTAGNGVLTGTRTVNAVGGIATFTDLRLDGSGNNVLTFSTPNPSLTVLSAGINVAVGPPAQLVMRTQPVGGASAVALPTQPAVEIRDVANQLTASALPVTVTMATGVGVLSGPVTVNAVNGVATFSQLAITGSGNYTLAFATAVPALTVTSSVLTIGGAPPPPPPGVQVLFTDGFESGDLSHVENGIRWSNASVDVTANIARAGGHAARFRQGDSYDWAELRFENVPNIPEAFVQYYIYYPSGNEVPSVGPKVITTGGLNDKFFRIWGGGQAGYSANPGNKVGASTWGDGSGTDNKLGLEFEGSPPDWPTHAQLYEGRTNDPLVAWLNDSRRGHWIQIRVHAKICSPADNDGVLQIWADGVLILSNTGLHNYPETAPKTYDTGYILGWGNNHFQVGQYTYVDDFTISTGGFPTP